MDTQFANLLDREIEPKLRSTQNVAVLPASLVVTEAAAALLRAYLEENGLADYRVFHAAELDLDDIDYLLPELGESAARWEHAPPFSEQGEPLSQTSYFGTWAYDRPTGFLRLQRQNVVVARWFWAALNGYVDGNLWLIAVSSNQALTAFRGEVVQARRRANFKSWQIIGESGDAPKTPRETGPGEHDSLVLAESLKDRVRSEVLRFFTPQVEAMYRELAVPYRRGVLLHGPPGNGKTSLIRWIGASLPRVAAISLRAWKGFDSDDLVSVMQQWTSQAPALLVLEDLDWLLEQVNVSTFLNLLDGLSTPPTGGLLLIATTNHPHKLDPAVNNRPGRFDAVIELPRPDAVLRERFIRAKLPVLNDAARAKAVSISDGLSFAHLQETLRLSGLRAISAGRSARTPQDVLDALAEIKASHDAAIRGFPPPTPTVPFGLAAVRKK